METEEELAPTRVYSTFYTHKKATCENTMEPFLNSVHLSVFPLLAGQSRKAVQSGDRGRVQRSKPDRTCDIWGHIYYLIYYLKAADNHGCSISI